MSEHTPHQTEETTDLLRRQVETASWDIWELKGQIGLLADMVEHYREEAHLLRNRLRQAEDLLAAQAAPMPVETGVGEVAA